MLPFAVAIFLCLPVVAQAADLALGEQTYREACAGCHGVDGRGDGPNSAMLSVAPPDLTRFAARSGGQYDRVRMVYLIDGREGLAAHGGPMPMFGGLLTGPSALLDAPEGTPVTTTEPILAITDYLETLQEE